MEESSQSESFGGRWPAWLVLLVAWLAADLIVRAVDLPGRRDRMLGRRQPLATARWTDPEALIPGELSTWTARELRGLPGIGPKRAVAIAQARWSRDRAVGPLPLEDIVGIGPRTVAGIAAELAERAGGGDLSVSAAGASLGVRPSRSSVPRVGGPLGRSPTGPGEPSAAVGAPRRSER